MGGGYSVVYTGLPESGQRKPNYKFAAIVPELQDYRVHAIARAIETLTHERTMVPMTST